MLRLSSSLNAKRRAIIASKRERKSDGEIDFEAEFPVQADPKITILIS